jgi:hypothetical protein
VILFVSKRTAHCLYVLAGCVNLAPLRRSCPGAQPVAGVLPAPCRAPIRPFRSRSRS